MNTETLENIGRVITIIVGTTVLIGIGAKILLLPWLRDNLVKPVEETNKQVTVNTHISEPSTMLDSVHLLENNLKSVDTKITNLSNELAHLAQFIGIINKMWDHHLEWSQSEVERLWDAINPNTKHRQQSEKSEGKHYESDH